MSVTLDDTVCRVCLSSSGNIAIFDGCGKDDQFRYCTSLEAAEDDGLPSKLCKKCNDHLKVAYDFRFQAIYAEKYFRKTIFLPSLKKEENGGVATATDEPNCTDELDENMAEIDMLLAIHTEAVDEVDNDDDDVDNSGFYDEESVDVCEKQVEVIGMETFEKEQREQKEQKVKIEGANVPPVVVSTTETENTGHLTTLPLMNSTMQSTNSLSSNVSEGQQPHVEVSGIQQYMTASPLLTHSVQNIRLEQEGNRSTQLEIMPILKNDPSTYDYNTTTSVVAEAYETYSAPTQMQFQQTLPMHLQYDTASTHHSTSTLQDSVVPTHNYEFSYQQQFPPFPTQTEQEPSHAVRQEEEIESMAEDPRTEDIQTETTTKTENLEPVNPKPKKAKREANYQRGKIECNICGNIFTHLNSLKTHLLKHSGEKPFRCEFCMKAFARKTVLNIHRRLHTGEKPYKCSLCTSAYVTKEALTRHLQKDHEQEVGANFRKDKVSYICSICNKSRCSKYSLASHMKTHSNETKPRRKPVRRNREKGEGSFGTSTNSLLLKYLCKICQKGFTSKWELSTHSESHAMHKTFECDICQRTFEKKFQLLYHLQTHDGGDELLKSKVQTSGNTPPDVPSEANKEEKPSSAAKKIKRRTSTRKRGKRKTTTLEEHTKDGAEEDGSNNDEEHFKEPQSRKSTIKRSTRAKRENLKALRASSKIECHICEAVFTHPTSLKTHMLVHSGERPFKCDHCDKSFARKTVLNIHRRLHTGEKPYKCPLCDMACVTKDALMRHMSKDHDDDRETDRIKFTCGICHKSMGTKYSLQAHMKLHEQSTWPGKPVKYSCNTCTESFDTKAEYTEHMEVHDSHRNFQCDICQATFEKKFKLLFHLQTHKIEDLPCKKCGETFTIRENLIQHIKLQHMDPRNMDFQCPHCHIGQYDTRDLKLHMLNTHDVTMGGLNACDLCGESHATAAEYYKHMHDKHDTISKTCNECEKYFDSRKAFDKHILTHYM